MRNFKAEHRLYGVMVTLGFLCTLLFHPCPIVFAEPGFWAIDSIDIPEVIKEKGGSVYQIIVLASDGHEILKRSGYAGALSKEKAYFDADVKKPPTETPTVDLGRYYQIESCINSSWGQCEVYRTLALGTAFEAGLDPSASSLWTSYGNVREVIKNYLEKEGLSDSDQEKLIEQMGIPINILLVDKDKKVVFDTRIPGRSAKLIDIAPRTGVVRIRLSEKISKPLLFGEYKEGAGRGVEDIYIMGYPVVQRDETRREDFYAYPLRRYNLAVTIGEVFQRPVYSRQDSQPKHIVCDADSAPGMSGAPALNERGELVGIFIRPMAFEVGSVLMPTYQTDNYLRN